MNGVQSSQLSFISWFFLQSHHFGSPFHTVSMGIRGRNTAKDWSCVFSTLICTKAAIIPCSCLLFWYTFQNFYFDRKIQVHVTKHYITLESNHIYCWVTLSWTGIQILWSFYPVHGACGKMKAWHRYGYTASRKLILVPRKLTSRKSHTRVNAISIPASFACHYFLFLFSLLTDS